MIPGSRIKEIRDVMCSGNNKLFAKIMDVKANTTSNWVSRGVSLEIANTILGKFSNVNSTWLLTGEGEMLKTDTPKPISLVENREGVISIPSDVWEVIKNQSASLKAKDDQINTLISQSKSERDETIQAFKGVISILEKELAKKGEDAGYPSHVAIRADTE